MGDIDELRSVVFRNYSLLPLIGQKLERLEGLSLRPRVLLIVRSQSLVVLVLLGCDVPVVFYLINKSYLLWGTFHKVLSDIIKLLRSWRKFSCAVAGVAPARS